jgi:hypothetical protein
LIIARFVALFAVVGYYGIKDILEADFGVHWAASVMIIQGVLWGSGMALTRHFIMKSKYRKYWSLWDIGKPDP